MSSVVRPGRKEEREESVNQRAGHVTVAHRGRTLVWGGYMENQVGRYSILVWSSFVLSHTSSTYSNPYFT